MGHHFNFFQSGYDSDSPQDERLRQFIRKYRKAILIGLAIAALLLVVVLVLIGLFLFKVVIPAFYGAVDSETAQSGFGAVKDLLIQFFGTNPLEWLNLL